MCGKEMKDFNDDVRVFFCERARSFFGWLGKELVSFGNAICYGSVVPYLACDIEKWPKNIAQHIFSILYLVFPLDDDGDDCYYY